MRTARFLNLPLETIQDPAAALVQPRRPTTDEDVLPAPIHAGIQIAQAVIRNLRDDPPAVIPPRTIQTWHAELRPGPDQPITPHTIVGDLWNRHIPVISVTGMPQPDCQILGGVIRGRPLVMMSDRITDHWIAAVNTAHHIGHIIAGDCADDNVVTHRDTPDRNSPSEARADAFAREVLSGRADRATVPADLSSNPPDAVSLDRSSDRADIRVSLFPDDQTFLESITHFSKTRAVHSVQSTLFNAFLLNIDVAAASETDTNLLRCVDAGTRTFLLTDKDLRCKLDAAQLSAPAFSAAIHLRQQGGIPYCR